MYAADEGASHRTCRGSRICRLPPGDLVGKGSDQTLAWKQSSKLLLPCCKGIWLLIAFRQACFASIPVRASSQWLTSPPWGFQCFMISSVRTVLSGCRFPFDLIYPRAVPVISFDVPGFQRQIISHSPRSHVRLDSAIGKGWLFLLAPIIHVEGSDRLPSLRNADLLLGRLSATRPSITKTPSWRSNGA